METQRTESPQGYARSFTIWHKRHILFKFWNYND